MHQIQKLDITGFKSFCDRTTLTFNEGITAVVGPNGCGKSNIADAISWVVGEQSAKSLRTDRMEGVIFNGTQARKATGMAEVALTLRLSDTFAVPEGLDLNPEAFTVGRRLYRSGESEYSIDGRRCRLRDIQALFEGTGLGPNSYALIEQGRIGQILSSKPADRRSLIEEAARITLFKSRRYSAEMKLELAQQNLLRIQDIIRELARQLSSLKRQAAKARRYNRLREELRALHKLRICLDQRRLGEELDLCVARFSEARQAEESVLSGLTRCEESRSSNRERCLHQEGEVNRRRDELSNLKWQAERSGSQLRHQKEQREELVRRLGDLDRELRASADRGDLVARESHRLRQQLEILDAELERGQEGLEAEQARNGLVREAMRETEARSEEVRSLLLTRAGQRADLRNLQARCMESIGRIESRAARIEAEQRTCSREKEGLLSRLGNLREEHRAHQTRREESARLQSDAEHRLSSLAAELEEAADEAMAVHEEYSLLQHRHSSLEEVERRRSNYSEGVQKFLSTQLPGEQPESAHTLADHIDTDPRYEAAVEDYLNDPLQYILVDGLEDALHSVERLKRIGAGKCTFLALRNGKTNGHRDGRPGLHGAGVIGYLGEILSMREDVRKAFERALPEYASTVLVEDLPTAFRVAEQLPGNHFLTLGGESYSTRGTLSAVGERKAMAGFLALKREKRELETRLEKMRGSVEAGRERVARLKSAQSEAAESLKLLTTDLRRLELESVSLQHSLTGLEADLHKMEQAEAVATEEVFQLSAEKAALGTQLAAAEAGIETTETQSQSDGLQLTELAARLDSLRSEEASLSKSLAALQAEHAVRRERRSGMDQDLKRLAAEAAEIEERARLLRSDREGVLARLEGLELEAKETEGQIEQLVVAVTAAESSLERAQESLALERESLHAVEADLHRLHREREEAMEARSRIEIEKTRLENDHEHLARSCRAEFHVSLQEIAAEIEEIEWERDYGEVCLEYEQLRERVEHFGAINMRALEEYQALDERYQFLGRQRADIEKSIADTQKAIADINRRSIEQFRDAFTRIRENFRDVFQILFKGGQCDLRLLDEGDMLESGIDIIAQPPGKRLQSVLLLSGGEKALTALALLIAIFRYRPSPFCVLDEVDAPLDDANIDRFTQLITELSRETQFILITHNKKTMEIGQTLYGVTMEEPGISKIVSVDFGAGEQALAS